MGAVWRGRARLINAKTPKHEGDASLGRAPPSKCSPVEAERPPTIVHIVYMAAAGWLLVSSHLTMSVPSSPRS